MEELGEQFFVDECFQGQGKTHTPTRKSFTVLPTCFFFKIGLTLLCPAVCRPVGG